MRDPFENCPPDEIRRRVAVRIMDDANGRAGGRRFSRPGRPMTAADVLWFGLLDDAATPSEDFGMTAVPTDGIVPPGGVR